MNNVHYLVFLRYFKNVRLDCYTTNWTVLETVEGRVSLEIKQWLVDSYYYILVDSGPSLNSLLYVCARLDMGRILRVETASLSACEAVLPLSPVAFRPDLPGARDLAHGLYLAKDAAAVLAVDLEGCLVWRLPCRSIRFKIFKHTIFCVSPCALKQRNLADPADGIQNFHSVSIGDERWQLVLDVLRAHENTHPTIHHFMLCEW